MSIKKIKPTKGVIIDFQTLIDPLKLAFALLMYIPVYGKVYVSEHVRNVTVMPKIFASRKAEAHRNFLLDDLSMWSSLLNDFESNRLTLRDGNIASAIELFILAKKAGYIDFLRPVDEELTYWDLEKEASRLGVRTSPFLEGIEIDYDKMGVSFVCPQWTSVGLPLNVHLGIENGYSISWSNQFVESIHSSVLAKLNLAVEKKSNPITEVFRYYDFPEKPSDVVSILNSASLFTRISEFVVKMDRWKQSESDLLWFFPKLMLSNLTGGFSSIAELAAVLYKYLRYRPRRGKLSKKHI